MIPLYLDLETFYDLEDYTLKTQSTESYVRDPRYETQLVAVAVGDGEEVRCFQPDETKMAIVARLAGDPDIATVAHNARFDCTALGEQHDIHPATIHCTQAMSRACGVSRISSESLAALTKFFGVESKGEFLASMSGRYARDLTPGEMAEYEDYNKKDVSITRKIYNLMLPFMFPDALDFISMTIKMYSHPRLVINKQVLEDYRVKLDAEAEADKERLAKMFSFPDMESFFSAIRSKGKFVEMLESLGVETPMKLSVARAKSYSESKKKLAGLLDDLACGQVADKTVWDREVKKHVANIKKGVYIPALAKSDVEFIALIEGPDEDVSILCQVRADQNSSIKQSRARTLLEVVERGTLPVPLQAFNARTGRYTAGNVLEDSAKSDSLQIQNLPKRGGDKTLRQSIEAPKGYVLVAADSSQIEARTGAWVAQQLDLLKRFVDGEDVYCHQGETLYGISAEELRHKAKDLGIQEFKTMRDVSKTTFLSSQYRISGRSLGLRLRADHIWLGEPGDLDFHFAESDRINTAYRGGVPNITGYWRQGDRILKSMCTSLDRKERLRGYMGGPDGKLFEYDTHRDVFGRAVPGFRLPSGFWIYLPNLRWHQDKDGKSVTTTWGSPEMVYDQRKGNNFIPCNIHGGLVFALCNQGLAFQILIWQGCRIDKDIRFDKNSGMVSNEHDCWIALVPENKVDETKDIFQRWMTQTPEWLTEKLPLACEVKSGYNFAEL